jgi:hypothetical protein
LSIILYLKKGSKNLANVRKIPVEKVIMDEKAAAGLYLSVLAANFCASPLKPREADTVSRGCTLKSPSVVGVSGGLNSWK